MTTSPISAIAVFEGKIQWTVIFTEDLIRKCVVIEIDLQGLGRNRKHGFHVHEAGDMSKKCESMCAHFNPYHTSHGCPGAKERHVGDLGNIEGDSRGHCKWTFTDDYIKLRGIKANIIGRGLIIHADEDDCGLGGNAESLKTGNAGKRIACAVIGIRKG